MRLRATAAGPVTAASQERRRARETPVIGLGYGYKRP
jgi:hypothetical protein